MSLSVLHDEIQLSRKAVRLNRVSRLLVRIEEPFSAVVELSYFVSTSVWFFCVSLLEMVLFLAPLSVELSLFYTKFHKRVADLSLLSKVHWPAQVPSRKRLHKSFMTPLFFGVAIDVCLSTLSNQTFPSLMGSSPVRFIP